MRGLKLKNAIFSKVEHHNIKVKLIFVYNIRVFLGYFCVTHRQTHREADGK